MQQKTIGQLNDLVYPLQQAKTLNQLTEIHNLRRREYQKHFPEITGYSNDPYDQQAVILFGHDDDHVITSTCRMVLDSAFGLPEDCVFGKSANKYRRRGLHLMEVGRFVIVNRSAELLRTYYRAFYQVAEINQVDTILMFMREKNYPFHKKMMNAKKLPESINNAYGSGHKFVTVAWRLNQTTDQFLSWVGTTHEQSS